MTLASVEAVTYAYPRAAAPALRDVNLEIHAGEFALVAGNSGGGKSTLLRLFNGLVPQFHGGVISGQTKVQGLDTVRTSARELATVAGMVFQEAEAQAVAETVIEEVAFGMEQRAVPRDEMRRRADRLLADLRIEHLRHRRLQTLSGGERQRVAIASVLAVEPALLLLDEPTSQLDGEGAESLLEALSDLNQRRGLTVLISEHRLDRLMPHVHRVVGVTSGTATPWSPAEALAFLDVVPPHAALFRRQGIAPRLTLEEARNALPAGLIARPRTPVVPGEELVSVEGLSVAYGEHLALRDVSFGLRAGEAVALIGPNGSGKSTLFRAIARLVRPARGTVAYPGSAVHEPRSTREVTAFAGLVPQDPALALYRETVREELADSLSNRPGARSAASSVGEALEWWSIGEFAARNPRDLSVGQQQRVAVAAMLAHGPRIWLLDEPTRGADGGTKEDLAARIRGHCTNGGAAIVATHDVESAALFATRVITLKHGQVVSDLPAARAFRADGPHPTQIARLVPGAVTIDEVAYAGH